MTMMVTAMTIKSLLDLTPEQLREAAERVAAKMIAEHNRMKEFVESERFKKMLDIFKDPNGTMLCEETFRYYPEQEKAVIGFTEFTDDEVRDFINAVADTEHRDRDFGPDEECMFDTANFVAFGIEVYLMFGQGTATTLSYPPHDMIENGEEHEVPKNDAPPVEPIAPE